MNKQTIAVGMVAFTTVVFAGCSNAQTSIPSEATPVAQTDVSATSTPTTIQAASYKDGVYDVKGSYNSPAGAETLGVKLTLKDNVVTDAEVVVEATNPKSKFMQDAFAGGYKEMVIGKKINDIHLEKVSGSSLTPIGFNDALEQIKSQAKTS